MRDLTLLADKYDCIEAIKPVINCWFSTDTKLRRTVFADDPPPLITKRPDDEAPFTITYLLDDAALFTEISPKMIMDQKNKFKRVEKEIDSSGRLPGIVFGEYRLCSPR